MKVGEMRYAKFLILGNCGQKLATVQGAAKKYPHKNFWQYFPYDWEL